MDHLFEGTLNTRRHALAKVGLTGVAVLGGSLAPAKQDEPPTPAPQQRRAMGYVLVTPGGPSDGGDFGPGTPKTKTSGIQEAIEYARSNRRDVYIAGGAMPGPFQNGAVYSVQDTIYVPWMQDFRLESGECVIDYSGPKKDVFDFDSQMSCRYKLGIVVNHSGGAGIRLRPRTKGPDNFCVITTTKFEINAPVGAGNVFFENNWRGIGSGLVMDATLGPIDSNDISVMEVCACDKGVEMQGPCTNNYIRLPFLHLCHTGLIMDKLASNNRIEATFGANGVKTSTGFIVNGKCNLLTLSVPEPTQEGRALVFAEDAEDNHVLALTLAGGFTSNAKRPTNRLRTCTSTGFNRPTPEVAASGGTVLNRAPFSAQVIITDPGEVRSWRLVDCLGTGKSILGSLQAGQSFMLDPGMAVGFDYSVPPQWAWYWHS